MDLNQLKAMIRSILSSAQSGLTEERLCKDYQEYENTSLLDDFKRLGFNGWEDQNFINTFRDTFTYRNRLFFAIPTERTKHIQSFVQKQKRTKGTITIIFFQISLVWSISNITPFWGSIVGGRNISIQKLVYKNTRKF